MIINNKIYSIRKSNKGYIKNLLSDDSEVLCFNGGNLG